MRPVQIILILLFGALTVYIELRDIKEWSLFGEELFYTFPLYALCILTIVYLFKNIRQYRQRKSMVSFVPAAIGFLFLAVTIGHLLLRSYYDNSPTRFTATNYSLGNDGGFTLDFKQNNHLKGRKIDHFSSTTYWGTYKQEGDTLVLNIHLDFKMGRRAVIHGNILSFVDDDVMFKISR